MKRRFWVLVHRYAGLYMAFFLIVAGLTGSVIAFTGELDHWLNPPDRVTPIPANGRPLLDPITLREYALKRVPGGRIDAISLSPKFGQPYTIGFSGAADGADAGIPQSLVLDPYTGEEIRRVAAPAHSDDYPYWPLNRKNLLFFLNSLHYTLTIPGSLGLWLFGIAAIVWTLDCFVGFYLTLPAWPKQGDSHSLSPEADDRRSFWQRWSVSWKIKGRGSAHRINFDLHRAFGLWTWLMLLLLAWSSVCLNLNEPVYYPVMKTLFGMEVLNYDIPPLDKPEPDPALSWREALAIGRKLMSEQAKAGQFTVLKEDSLGYDSTRGVFTYIVNSSRDLNDWGGTEIRFRGGDGGFVGLETPTGQNVANTFTSWITMIHYAAIWGLPLKIFISFMGLVTAMLSITGVYLWLKKRQGRRKLLERKPQTKPNV